MLEGKTTSGFKFKITDERLDNYELLDAIAKVETNPLLIVKVVDLLLGEEQKQSLMDHLRTDDGIVPTSKISTEIMEIFESSKDTKNS